MHVRSSSSFRHAALAATVVLLAAAAPAPSFAWPAPAGSPAGWTTFWVQTTHHTNLYSTSAGMTVLGGADIHTSFRVDAPGQSGRYWVFNPLTSGWGWLPVVDTEPGSDPAQSAASASDGAARLSPQAYLYQQWPDTASRMDCVINYESSWNARATNPRSGAAGLAQFESATWMSTPQGQAGESAYDPYASIDAFGWMVHGGGRWTEWTPVLLGYC